jgi:peroxiredoxin
MNTVKPAPRPGMQVPGFGLVSTRGQEVHLREFRHRHNLVLVFVGSPDSEVSRRLLPELARHHPEFGTENTRILAVIHAPHQQAIELQHRADLPFPVLVDEEGTAHRTAGAWVEDGAAKPAIYVTDRFGELYAAYHPDGSEGIPTADAILEWLRFVELQCPE